MLYFSRPWTAAAATAGHDDGAGADADGRTAEDDDQEHCPAAAGRKSQTGKHNRRSYISSGFCFFHKGFTLSLRMFK